MDIGEKLKAYRNNLGLTQEEVSKKIYVSRATISSWETNRTSPDIDKIIDLSLIYDVSLDDLLKSDPQILERLRLERKKLKRYKLLKILITPFVLFFIIYNMFWFISVFPKNFQLDKNWKKVGTNYYIKEYNSITFQAHSARYLEPLNNFNIAVSTYKNSFFQITIDGDNIFIGTNDSTPNIPSFFGKTNKRNIKELEMISGNKKDAEKTIKNHKEIFKKELEVTYKIWKQVNSF